MTDSKTYGCDFAKVVGSPAQGVMKVGLLMGGGSREENAAATRTRVGIVGTSVGVSYGGVGGEGRDQLRSS